MNDYIPDPVERIEASVERAYDELSQPGGKFKCYQCDAIFDPEAEGGTISPHPEAMPVCGKCYAQSTWDLCMSRGTEISLLKKKISAMEKLNNKLLDQHELRVRIGHGGELPPWAVNLISGCEKCGGSGYLPEGFGEQGSPVPCSTCNPDEYVNHAQKCKSELEAKMADTEKWPDLIGSGGDSPSYCASMKDAGRGHLLP